MQGISHQRLIIYVLLLGLGPLFFVIGGYLANQSHQERIELALNDAISQAGNKNIKGYINKQVRQQFRDTDHFYIDKEVETIVPLTQEIDTLQKTLQRGFHQDEEQLRKRLQFLTKGQNSISFTEGSVKAYPNFQETIETLAHPVELDLDDIKRCLAKIEGVPLGAEDVGFASRPHLIITDCKIERKKGLTQEVFSLDLKVLKREYLR